jgi:hypothetical protein
MKDHVICAKCGLLLPPNSAMCDCGFAIGNAQSVDAAHIDRQFRNMCLFTNAFTAMGLFMIWGSLIRPVDWKGIAQGLSGVSGAWAFWSLVQSEGEATIRGLRRRLEYGAVTGSILLFALGIMGREFRVDLLLWLVMPGCYVWRYSRRRG